MRAGMAAAAPARKIYTCALRPNRAAHPASNSSGASRAKPQVESAGTAALALVVTVYVERLLAVFGSGVVETTVAVLSNDPSALGLVTTSVIVAELDEPLEGILPREQVTVPELEEQGDVAETNVVPAGKTSVTVTPAAAEGPAFVTVRV